MEMVKDKVEIFYFLSIISIGHPCCLCNALLAPFYGFIGGGMALYFAAIAMKRVLWPVLAGTVRLLIAACGGWLAVYFHGVAQGLDLPSAHNAQAAFFRAALDQTAAPKPPLPSAAVMSNIRTVSPSRPPEPLPAAPEREEPRIMRPGSYLDIRV